MGCLLKPIYFMHPILSKLHNFYLKPNPLLEKTRKKEPEKEKIKKQIENLKIKCYNKKVVKCCKSISTFLT